MVGGEQTQRCRIERAGSKGARAARGVWTRRVLLTSVPGRLFLRQMRGDPFSTTHLQYQVRFIRMPTRPTDDLSQTKQLHVARNLNNLATLPAVRRMPLITRSILRPFCNTFRRFSPPLRAYLAGAGTPACSRPWTSCDPRCSVCFGLPRRHPLSVPGSRSIETDRMRFRLRRRPLVGCTPAQRLLPSFPPPSSQSLPCVAHFFCQPASLRRQLRHATHSTTRVLVAVREDPRRRTPRQPRALEARYAIVAYSTLTRWEKPAPSDAH